MHGHDRRSAEASTRPYRPLGVDTLRTSGREEAEDPAQEGQAHRDPGAEARGLRPAGQEGGSKEGAAVLTPIVDELGESASRGAALGAVLGFVAATVPRAHRPLKEVMGEVVAIAGFWGLLGGLFGVVYEGLAQLD